MSISGSLANALSGLTAAARAAQVVSSNVANATTEGYGRRILQTSPATLGGQGAGVRIDGVLRDVDPQLIADRRLADADAAHADRKAAFFARLETSVGLPSDAGSLSGRIAALETALIGAASRPDSDARLSQVASAAREVTSRFNDISSDIQSLRMDADRDIAQQVGQLNDRLEKVADLNHKIRRQMGAGHDAAGLMDQRQRLVDDTSEIIPLRAVSRDSGEIALYSATGATLLDGQPASFGFAPVGTIVPEMTIASGALSGLELNGEPVSTSGPYAPAAGGSLSALFDQRDALAVDAQTELDALARDLIARFQTPGLDPTVPAGAAGLFTDLGAAFDPANEAGIASRLQLNRAVDPADGGSLWRLRDGLGAATAGPPGNAGLLNAFADVLSETRSVASGRFTGSTASASDLSAEYLSFVGGARQSAEADQSFARAKGEVLKTAELEFGVDTDQEMQKLLLIEQAYSANARVVRTIDDMMQTLLSI
ncbi:flagellar hook protein FlgK [Rhodovulum sp. NI22]|nr:flagellar hook protein FlgK [Rhodovulum sp. NI22]